MKKQKSKSRFWTQINPPVFFASALIILILTIYTIFDPDGTGNFFSTINAWIVASGSWFYVLSVTIFLLFTVFLGLSRSGSIKLGPDHSEPDYSYISWFAMLFSAGMGVGLMFFGVAEPVMHYMNPPLGVGETVDAARRAMQITFFHWGMHAWGIYAI